MTDNGGNIRKSTNNGIACGDYGLVCRTCNGAFTLNGKTESETQLCLKVFNPLGKQIYSLDKIQVNGTYSQQIDLGAVAPGLYSVVVNIGPERSVQKVVITR